MKLTNNYNEISQNVNYFLMLQILFFRAPFDGPLGVIAHSNIPINGKSFIHFDADELWSVYPYANGKFVIEWLKFTKKIRSIIRGQLLGYKRKYEKYQNIPYNQWHLGCNEYSSTVLLGK